MSEGRIPLSTCESLGVVLSVDDDPTSDTVGFFWTDGSDTDQPANGEFVAGSWVAGSYNSRSKTAEARTHTAGNSAAVTPGQTISTAGDYRLWARVVSATEAPVIDLGVWTFY